MIDQPISKEPISRTFELPEDLEQQFLLEFAVEQAAYPSCFSRVVMKAIRTVPSFPDFPPTSDSYFRKELRDFLDYVVRINYREFTKMTPQGFFDQKIKPNLTGFNHMLRKAFAYLENDLEKDRNHAQQMQEARALLERSQSERGEVAVVLNTYKERLATLMQEFDQLTELANEANEQADKDSLTKLQNRRSFDREMSKLALKSPDERFAVMMLDMDLFKQVNDGHGHKAGDQVLKQFAGLITGPKTGLRYEDVVRWGGEEFVVVIPDKDGRGLEVAHAIRRAVKEHVFLVKDTSGAEVELKKTISIGLSRCFGHELANLGVDSDDSPEKPADAALYKAKGKKLNDKGHFVDDPLAEVVRDCIVVAGKDKPEPRL